MQNLSVKGSYRSGVTGAGPSGSPPGGAETEMDKPEATSDANKDADCDGGLRSSWSEVPDVETGWQATD